MSKRSPRDWETQNRNWHRERVEKTGRSIADLIQENFGAAAIRDRRKWLYGDWDAPNGSWSPSPEELARQAAEKWARWLNAHLEGHEIDHAIATPMRLRRMVLIHGLNTVAEVVDVVIKVTNIIRRHSGELGEMLTNEELLSMGYGDRSIIDVLRLNFVISCELSDRLYMEGCGIKVVLPQETGCVRWDPDESVAPPTIMGIPVTTLGRAEFTQLLIISDEYR